MKVSKETLIERKALLKITAMGKEIFTPRESKIKAFKAEMKSE